jgi:hypothetical protein
LVHSLVEADMVHCRGVDWRINRICIYMHAQPFVN